MSNPELEPFREFLRRNRIGLTSGYKLAAEGKIKLTKVGSRTYVTREAIASFLANLQQAA